MCSPMIDVFKYRQKKKWRNKKRKEKDMDMDYGTWFICLTDTKTSYNIE